jgi:predicted CoA-binding protein
MVFEDRIEKFLAGSPHAVVGASTDRAKYGNKVLRAYLQNKREVYPVNPNAAAVEGLTAYPDLMALPVVPHGISIITPPEVTEGIVVQAVELGIEHIWMQPGAESDEAVRRAEAAGINVIHSGPCLLVVLGYRETV